MSDLNKLKDIYTHVKNQANSLRGQSSKYSEITGLCPVNTIELQAGCILDLIDQLEAAEAEFARRDAAAGEAVYQVQLDDDQWFDASESVMVSQANHGAKTRVLFTAAQPSALPPEIVRNINGLGFYQGRLIFAGAAGWYNQAIADAKALGCKAIKLPDDWDSIEHNEYSAGRQHGWNECLEASAKSLKAQGFTVEG